MRSITAAKAAVAGTALAVLSVGGAFAAGGISDSTETDPTATPVVNKNGHEVDEHAAFGQSRAAQARARAEEGPSAEATAETDGPAETPTDVTETVETVTDEPVETATDDPTVVPGEGKQGHGPNEHADDHPNPHAFLGAANGNPGGNPGGNQGGQEPNEHAGDHPQTQGGANGAGQEHGHGQGTPGGPHSGS